MPEIVIAEFMDEAAIREHLAGRDVLYDPKLVDQPEALLAAVSEARALVVRNRTQVRGALLEAAKHLEVVGRLGVGLDNIDVDACRERGIAVYPATGANDVAVAEYVVTAMLVLLRGAWSATPEVIAGRWPRMSTIGREVSGKQLGLVGFGGIARQTAQRAHALGMSVCAYDPLLDRNHEAWSLAKPTELAALLASSDVVSLHVPLTAQTRHMIGATQLATMKRNAILINTARGGIVDEAALVAALRRGELGGAALDVFEHEPLDASRAVIFADIEHLLLTPHIAGVTEESNVRVSHLTAKTVREHLDAATKLR